MNTLQVDSELEMYHQIKNVGINPTFFEYLFMDTTVEPYFVNRLIFV